MRMFKIGFYPVGVGDIRTMYNGGLGSGRGQKPDLTKTELWFSMDYGQGIAPKVASTDPSVALANLPAEFWTGLEWIFLRAGELGFWLYFPGACQRLTFPL